MRLRAALAGTVVVAVTGAAVAVATGPAGAMESTYRSFGAADLGGISNAQTAYDAAASAEAAARDLLAAAHQAYVMCLDQ